jgi:hypothetical protein
MLRWTDFTCENVVISTTSRQMVPSDANWRPIVAGHPIRVRGRGPAAALCRDDVLAALSDLGDRSSRQTFTVREVHREMTARGTVYAGPSRFKSKQRMKATPIRPLRGSTGRSEGVPGRLLEAGQLEPGDADGDREGGPAQQMEAR